MRFTVIVSPSFIAMIIYFSKHHHLVYCLQESTYTKVQTSPLYCSYFQQKSQYLRQGIVFGSTQFCNTPSRNIKEDSFWQKHQYILYFYILVYLIEYKVYYIGRLNRKNKHCYVVYYAVAMCAHPNNAACSTTFASSEPYYMPIKQRESICNALFPSLQSWSAAQSFFFAKNPSTTHCCRV